MTLSITALVSIIFGAAGFSTTLVVVGYMVGSFKSQFVSCKKFDEHTTVMSGQMKSVDLGIQDLALKMARLEGYLKGVNEADEVDG